MGLFSKPIKTLDDLFVHTLQDIYYAENQIAKNLPTMVEKASNPELKSAFQQHLTETQNQVKRLEQVFQMHGQPVKAVTCAAMDGILSEAKEIMGDCDDPQVRDAAMISAAHTPRPPAETCPSSCRRRRSAGCAPAPAFPARRRARRGCAPSRDHRVGCCGSSLVSAMWRPTGCSGREVL